MQRELFTNSMNLAKRICEDKLNEGNIVIDATMGKGNDTVFLCNLVGQRGKVYAFDIQSTATEKTKGKLQEHNLLSRVKLINDGHENMDKYVQEQVNLVMFNLGYLPGDCHNITTKRETTLQALKKSLKLLIEGGVIIIVVYHGHEEGKKEKEVLENFIPTLNQKNYNVTKLEFINQINNPPMLICIEKRILSNKKIKK